ncbi:hypothetical protein B0A49_14011 [Cryomyces minteri]|uniref:Uncharacterized protein n=1 Tax=Cryomyces minteri TaxID=331657 RepID=A0A4U0WDD0_9PEZI|nr:hypothetical protein B0A49_14011 [Cryomyces minteri]
MAALRSFNPLNVAKRKTQDYSSAPREDPNDLEKRTSVESSDFMYPSSSSTQSSRETSETHQPMLRRSSSAQRKASAYTYRAPRRFSRYFAIALGSTLVIFILTLTRLSWSSAKNVQLGLSKPPPKPPAWEEFPFLTRYHGGIRTLTSREHNKPEYPGGENNPPQAPAAAGAVEEKESTQRREGQLLQPGNKFIPYPDYASDTYKSEYGSVAECYLDVEKSKRPPQLHSYHGIPRGFPDPIMGSYELLGIRNDVCFERYGRLGPYGYGYSRKLGGSGAGMEGDREGAEAVWVETTEIDYRPVKWMEVQERCAEANRYRFRAKPKGRNHFFQTMAVGGPDQEPPAFTSGGGKELDVTVDGTQPSNGTEQLRPKEPRSRKLLPRTAVLIRTWWDYNYDAEDLFFLRALVSELSILSGGEYTIHFLIHVKDDNMQIWSDDETYQRVLDNALPNEFKGMGTLWSERQMGLIYGGVEESFYRDLPVHGAYRSTFMPVQYFAHQHPEYDFVWHWEMDIRYTGHFYHLFTQVSEWAKRQPRKGLWERNGRFYVPSEHGSWEDFRQMVRVQTEHGTASKQNIYAKLAAGVDPNNPNEAQERPEKPIWGPHRPEFNDLEADHDVLPPDGLTYARDDYTWGVGEEADLITFNPLFDPAGTNWILAADVTGYNHTAALPPRRTAIITAARLSRRLLETMHRETALKRHTMFSEMWPGSVALHHGLKAVYAPHPVYIDRRWPPSYLAAIFNNGRNGAAGGARTSVFSDERQHNFLGTTWYYHAGFAGNLWRRWLGYKVDNDGGEEAELAGEGRMCLPAMLLHPVKQVDLIYEHREGE